MAAAPSFRSGEAVRAFLKGKWSFAKTVNYRIGGGRGTISGTATFTQTLQRPDVLMYEEQGLMQLEGMPKPFECYRKYCFNTGVFPVEVYLVDDPTKKEMPTLIPEIPEHTAFFVPLPFGDLSEGEGMTASFKHLCVNDMYSGELSVPSQNAFMWNWSVVGPSKDGTIQCQYERLDPGSGG
mmetsp:Transcript_23366/g.42969  ORF Transcript_23366/g.42969 Transcript_23366/m.42969 type:complete len:181 (-) Transcript_23366:35-577(-)